MRIINSLTPYYEHESVHFLEGNKEYSIVDAENGLMGNYTLTFKALYDQSIPEKTRQKILNSELKNGSMAAIIYLLNTESWYLIIRGEYDLVIDINWLHNEQLDHWQGWSCEAGATRLLIDKDFEVYSGECKNDSLGNALAGFDLLESSICKQDRCTGCTDDLIVAKHKT